MKLNTGAFMALIDHMKEKHYPDDEERARFQERVRADLSNHDYRLWFDSYIPPPKHSVQRVFPKRFLSFVRAKRTLGDEMKRQIDEVATCA